MLDPRKGKPALDKKRGQAWWPRPAIPAREAEMGGSSSSTARDPQRPSLQTELGLRHRPLGEQCLPRVLGEMEPPALKAEFAPYF